MRPPALPEPPRVAALVTAAGASSRMGGAHKALLPWGAGPLVAHQVRTLAARLGGSRASIVVVVGARGDEVARAVPPPGLVVVNERWREGRSTSLAAGLRALQQLEQLEQLEQGHRGRSEAVLVVAVDQPLHAATVAALLDAFDPARHALAVPSYQGRRGHPVVLSARLWSELVRVEDEPEGLRTIVRRHASQRLEVPVGHPVRWDLNTPEDYARARAAASAPPTPTPTPRDR